ncbi:MAG: T9SS type A sorting domain-containing protein [Bacteroidetes bacterium]|nr:T9SS type A sorting domain-containing protein [Bacteroidota bacterium]
MTLRFTLPLFVVCITTSALAQKPNTPTVAEIRLPAENDAWHMEGPLRVLDRTGKPAALYQQSYRPVAVTPEAMAREYLTVSRNILGLSPADIQGLRLHSTRTDDAGTVVRLRQTWKGLPVNKNAEITIHISPDRRIDFVMNGFQYGITLNDVQPVISAAAAKQHLMTYLHAAGNIDHQSEELMVLRNNNTDYLVYRVVIITDNPVGEWEAYVDAKTGTLLQSTDISNYHHGKPSPQKPQPQARPFRVNVAGTGNVFDPDPLTTATAVYGGSYVDGTDANAAVLTAQLKSVTLNDITLTAGTYSLVGPYAEIRDFEAPAKGLFSQASSTFAFDRSADGFEAVNTYYHIDAMMRYLNVTLGLNIHPYQYTGGVRFDPSGLSGADNSHYLSGSGQLAFGEGGVDDAEDADVIIHELGHGLHDWVTVGGLSQVNGLSEGIGDYIAGSYSRFKGFWPTANAAYNWTFNWDGHNPFWGGRVLNYGAVYPGGLTSAIHTDGQIWATANMKIWDDIGRQKADKAFWAGLALTNSSTNQSDAANAVYQAATNMGYTNTERQAIRNRYIAAGYTMPAFLPLPVKLLAFNATKAGVQINVSWKTSMEENSSSFVIERSADGSNFQAIGTLAAAGNSTSERNYVFADILPLSGNNYYRLRSVSMDGTADYSLVVLVVMGKSQSLQLFPNPVKDLLTIKQSFNNGTVYIYDANGKQVFTRQVTGFNSNNTSIRIGNLAPGIYVVKLHADGMVYENKIMKN